MDNTENTIQFSLDNSGRQTIREIINQVFAAMQEKGYDPINQLVGYLLSGDPTYITSHKNARALIRRFERDEILEELVAFYLSNME
ncbi:MAG: IreB family regulatory phosphoprotein [Christensenellales bacterium]